MKKVYFVGLEYVTFTKIGNTKKRSQLKFAIFILAFGLGLFDLLITTFQGMLPKDLHTQKKFGYESP